MSSIISDRSPRKVTADTRQSIFEVPSKPERYQLEAIKNRYRYTKSYLQELRDACHKTDRYLCRYVDNNFINKSEKKRYQYVIGVDLKYYEPFLY